MRLDSVTEDMVVREVREVLKLHGLLIQRINTGCFAIGDFNNRRYIRTAEKGTLDFVGMDHHGRHVEIECKRPVGGRLSPEQKRRIETINGCGGVAIVVHSGYEAITLLKERNCL
jgi:hypothetical protein